MGLVFCVVCPFTPQLLLVLITHEPGWMAHWVGVGNLVRSSHGRDLNRRSPRLYHTTSALNITEPNVCGWYKSSQVRITESLHYSHNMSAHSQTDVTGNWCSPMYSTPVVFVEKRNINRRFAHSHWLLVYIWIGLPGRLKRKTGHPSSPLPSLPVPSLPVFSFPLSALPFPSVPSLSSPRDRPPLPYLPPFLRSRPP